MGRRKVRKKQSLPKGIDSKLELTLSQSALQGCNWKPKSLEYYVHKEYHPDAQYGDLLIEIKGYFRTSAEASKYVHIQAQNSEYELVFIFANPDKPITWAKRRKDGTRMTHAQWADRNNFKYYSTHNTPKEWSRK